MTFVPATIRPCRDGGPKVPENSLGTLFAKCRLVRASIVYVNTSASMGIGIAWMLPGGATPGGDEVGWCRDEGKGFDGKVCQVTPLPDSI